jgi:hypothetical protein
MRTVFNLYCTLQTLSHDEGCHENRLQSILYSSDSLPWWGAVWERVWRVQYRLKSVLMTAPHHGRESEEYSIDWSLFSWQPSSWERVWRGQYRLKTVLMTAPHHGRESEEYSIVMRTDFNLYCTLQTLSHDEGLSWEQTSIYTVLFRLSPMMRGCHENRLQSKRNKMTNIYLLYTPSCFRLSCEPEDLLKLHITLTAICFNLASNEIYQLILPQAIKHEIRNCNHIEHLVFLIYVIFLHIKQRLYIYQTLLYCTKSHYFFIPMFFTVYTILF